MRNSPACLSAQGCWHPLDSRFEHNCLNGFRPAPSEPGLAPSQSTLRPKPCSFQGSQSDLIAANATHKIGKQSLIGGAGPGQNPTRAPRLWQASRDTR